MPIADLFQSLLDLTMQNSDSPKCGRVSSSNLLQLGGAVLILLKMKYCTL